MPPFPGLDCPDWIGKKAFDIMSREQDFEMIRDPVWMILGGFVTEIYTCNQGQLSFGKLMAR